MPAIVSLLRGVNLGPKRQVNMEELRKVYESLKLRSPQTFINSGNVVFATTSTDLRKLAKRIEGAIEAKFGFRSDVVLRTTEEMRDVVGRNPFAGRKDVEGGKLLVTFFAEELAPDLCVKVRAIQSDPEEIVLDGRELFVHYPEGMGRSKLTQPLTKVLKQLGTARNWNTVTKLLTLAEALE